MTVAAKLRAAALVSKAWPYEEARKLLKRYPDGAPAGGIVFETGYGPSGMPHLGTFQEVARTLMVRHALSEMVDWPSRLIAFSDDMDGMRKVPPNVPHQDMMHEHLDQPLSKVPDPYGCGHASYAAHNNGLLRQFLDDFGFDYEFLASSDCYGSGRFDEALKGVLRNYQAIMDVMLPTLGAERRQTYSPVLPISGASGKVLQVPVEVIDPEAGTISYVEPETGERVEQSILGGGAKLQWKVDWAMRWAALGVDYEMSGKDLIDSVTQSSKITRILGHRPPEGFHFEMFLDENGEKISKSKGNGLTIDEWLTYAPPESLAFYIYRDPRKAKQLGFSIIPRAVDEYQQFLAAYPDQEWDKRLGNPVHHVHAGDIPPARMPLNFASPPQPGRRRLDRRQGSALGLRQALRAGGVARNASRARRADRPRARLFPRFRRRLAPPPSARRNRAGSASRPRFQARRASGRGRRGGNAVRGLRGRQGAPVREPSRLVQGALRNSARHQPGAAHGEFLRPLRDRQ